MDTSIESMHTENETPAERREADWLRVRSLLRKYAFNSLAYLSLEDDKQWFFSEKVDGVASYALSGHTMVVCGDPVCRHEDLPVFLREILDYAESIHRHLIFLGTLETCLSAYREAGLGIYKSGEEAVFSVPTWSMAGGKCAKARSNYHTAVHHGLTVHEYKPYEKRDPAIEQEMKDISAQWFDEKHTSRLQFAVGTMMLDRECDKRYFYAVDKDGVMQGFHVLNPYLSGKGWIVDIMRRRDGCPHGVMELLFHDEMELLKKEGAAEASFGIAPLFNTEDEPHPTAFEKGEHYVFENMNYIYGFKSLYEAKNKFNPTWKNIYIVCSPRHMSLLMDKDMCAVLDTAGFSDYVRAFADMIAEEHREKVEEHKEKAEERREEKVKEREEKAEERKEERLKEREEKSEERKEQAEERREEKIKEREEKKEGPVS
ncbi:MAG: DUF2156 domain-containing protein [Eubacteriales bacterium]|nr:DUF2156 domain-containing protein [Eubacteriales bacterium]